MICKGQDLSEDPFSTRSRDRFGYEHRSAVKDIGYWENQSTLPARARARARFDWSSRRAMKRVSLAGGPPS